LEEGEPVQHMMDELSKLRREVKEAEQEHRDLKVRVRFRVRDIEA